MSRDLKAAFTKSNTKSRFRTTSIWPLKSKAIEGKMGPSAFYKNVGIVDVGTVDIGAIEVDAAVNIAATAVDGTVAAELAAAELVATAEEILELGGM